MEDCTITMQVDTALNIELASIKERLAELENRSAANTKANNDSTLQIKNESDMTFSDKVLIFTQEATCHGIPHIGRKNISPDRRFIWIVCTLLCVAALCYFIANAFLTYYSYPSMTTIRVLPQEAIEFPAVTVCNNNRIKRSWYQKALKNGSIVATDSFEAYIEQQIHLGKIYVTVSNTITINDYNGTKEAPGDDNITEGQFLMPYDYNGTRAQFFLEVADESLKQSLHDDWDIECNYQDWERIYKEGGHQLQETVLTEVENRYIKKSYQYHHTKVRSFIFPGFGYYCHTLIGYEDEAFQHPLKANITDTFISMDVVLDPLEDEYFTGGGVHQGFTIAIHPLDEIPGYADFIDIENGNDYEIRLSKTTTRILATPYNPKDCVTNKRNLTELVCKLACVADGLKKQCGCRFPGVPNSDLPLCSSSPELKECENSSYESPQCLKCLPECETIHFDFTHSKSQSRESQMSISIYYREMTYTEIVQSPSYTAVNLFGDVGGVIGLFLGASILTFTELIDFMLFSICFSKK